MTKIMVRSDEICQTLLMVFVAYDQWCIQGIGWEICILSPAIFKNVFDVYNFFIIYMEIYKTFL